MFKLTLNWPNFPFGQLFMWIGANNDHYMTSYGLDDWFWAMFEPTWTWPNFTFGQLFMWTGANNDQIGLLMDQMESVRTFWAMFEPTETFPNFTFGQLFMRIGANNNLISLLVNFSCELGQIMTRYDFLWVRRVILSNVRTNLNLT